MTTWAHTISCSAQHRDGCVDHSDYITPVFVAQSDYITHTCVAQDYNTPTTTLDLFTSPDSFTQTPPVNPSMIPLGSAQSRLQSPQSVNSVSDLLANTDLKSYTGRSVQRGLTNLHHSPLLSPSSNLRASRRSFQVRPAYRYQLDTITAHLTLGLLMRLHQGFSSTSYSSPNFTKLCHIVGC